MPDLTVEDKHAGLLAQILTEWKTLAILGGPILIAQLAQMANAVIDTVMAGRASAADLAGVGIGSSLWVPVLFFFVGTLSRSEEHTSELQSRENLVCRLLLEKRQREHR